jgi:pSer/pThr/pTyr-binding forkhead associated (FHA) protein
VPGRASVRLGPTLSVGRDESCDLSFAGDSYVSSRHCSITVAPGGRASLRDLGSTNGTFRRLAPRSERELLNGDCLRLGAQVLQIFESK